MAKQIEWTNQAKDDRINILDYFLRRNKSSAYSKKLNRIFIKETKYISKYPEIGKPSNSKNVRIRITGNYYIIYMIEGETIYIY